MSDRKTVKSSDPVLDAGRAGLPPCLVQVYGGELGRRYELKDGELVVGRDDDCGIAIDLPTISRRHARFFEREGGVLVEDLGSTNGTLVNQREVRGEVPLRGGDLVKVGGAILKFLEGGDVEATYHEELYRLTISDGLTQLANKRHLLESLEKEALRARRHGRPMSLVMADVDHFKRVNDEHGHLAGDDVLRGVADVLRKVARKDELVARYGGEEFAIVLAEVGTPGALDLAERVRTAVEGQSLRSGGEVHHVTVSLGVATLRDGESIPGLIARADAALYAAKRGGRNRVVAASQD